MVAKRVGTAAPALATLTIADLCNLFETCQHLERTMLGELALPAVTPAAAGVIDAMMVNPLSRFQIRVVDELQAREPSDMGDAERRAAVLARWEILGGDFRAADKIAGLHVLHQVIAERCQVQ